MTNAELDTLWSRAEQFSGGFTRYRFAALVAAQEREACARVCESVIEEIRETADNVLSHEDCRSIQAAQDCAAAIRARSKE